MLNWLCRRVLFSWGILRNPLKRKIINLTNSKIGSEIYYKAGSKIYNTGYFELGDRCFVSRDCSFITGTDAFPIAKLLLVKMWRLAWRPRLIVQRMKLVRRNDAQVH